MISFILRCITWDFPSPPLSLALIGFEIVCVPYIWNIQSNIKNDRKMCFSSFTAFVVPLVFSLSHFSLKESLRFLCIRLLYFLLKYPGISAFLFVRSFSQRHCTVSVVQEWINKHIHTNTKTHTYTPTNSIGMWIANLNSMMLTQPIALKIFGKIIFYIIIWILTKEETDQYLKIFVLITSKHSNPKFPANVV